MKKLSILLQESTLARFLLPVGLIATIFGVAVLIISIQNSNYKEVEAKVTKVELEQEAYTDTDGNHQDETYTVYVSYTVDGTNYNSELSGLKLNILLGRLKFNLGKKSLVFLIGEK
jgi:hypothetical protein